jgi:hypothetical protein
VGINVHSNVSDSHAARAAVLHRNRSRVGDGRVLDQLPKARLRHLVISGTLVMIQGTLVMIQGTSVMIQGTLVMIQGTLVMIQDTLVMIQGALIMIQETLV